MKPKILVSVITCVAAASLILAGCGGTAGSTTPATSATKPPTTTSQAPASTTQAPATTSQAPTTSAQPSTTVTPTASSTTAAPPSSTFVPPTTSTTPPLPTTTTTKPPVTTSIAPTTSAPPASTQKPLGGEAPLVKTHPPDGAFAACLSCHLDTIKPSPVLHQISLRHGCDQCHARTPMIDIFGHEESLVSMPAAYETTCLECHAPQPEHK